MSSSNKRIAFILGAVTLLGILLRLYRLAHQSLWFDEVLTATRSARELAEVVSLPSLHYLLVHAVLPFGPSDLMVRVPSMVLGSMSIPLFYAVARNWHGRETALLAAAFFAVSPFHIWYSQEARTYALLLFLALLTLWMFQRILAGRANVLDKLGFVFLGAAMVYCHLIAIGFLAFTGACVLFSDQRMRWGLWGPIFASILVLLGPKVIYLLTASPNAEVQQEAFNVLSIGYGMWAFAAGYSLGPTPAELHVQDRMAVLVRHLPVILPVLVSVGFLFLAGLQRGLRKEAGAFGYTALWFLVPTAFGVAGALRSGYPLSPRYLSLALPAFLIFLALGVTGFRRHWMRAAGVAVIAVISALSLQYYYFDERYQRTDNRAAGRFLRENARPADLVVCIAYYTRACLEYYAGGSDLTLVGYPMPGSGIGKELSFGSKHERIEWDMRKLVHGREEFWLFLSRSYHGDPEGAVRRYLDEHFQRDLVFVRSGLQLIRYRRGKAAVFSPRPLIPASRAVLPGTAGDGLTRAGSAMATGFSS